MYAATLHLCFRASSKQDIIFYIDGNERSKFENGLKAAVEELLFCWNDVIEDY